MKATKHSSPAINSAAFTLLEVMIALAIIGMTVTVILHTVNYHADIMYENMVSTSLLQTAKEKMSELETDHAASKGSAGSGITYEKIVSKTGLTGIVELRATVTGHGKEVTLTELAREREEL